MFDKEKYKLVHYFLNKKYTAGPIFLSINQVNNGHIRLIAQTMKLFVMPFSPPDQYLLQLRNESRQVSVTKHPHHPPLNPIFTPT